MQVNSKYFGSVEFEEKDVLHFERGLFGFEEETQFLLLPFAGSAATLLCFQSTQTPGLAFVAMDPFALKPDYTPVLQQEELSLMQVTDSHQLGYYVLCVVRNPVAESTVNLKCPVVVNPDTKRAMQVILEETEYQMRHSLSEFRHQE